MSDKISEYIIPGKRIHLVGIGGVSMRALGEVLFGAGMRITGSDMSESEAVEHLRSIGVPVTVGHRAENVRGADCLVRTAAVHNDNPEIAAARAAGIPIFERAQVWGHIMKQYENVVCIAGTHGKTTTSSMMAHIAMAAQTDPTVMIGGTLPLIGAGHRVGARKLMVAESCEYCNSFLHFAPTVAVILNVEEDHLDFFSGLPEIIESFHRFACLVPETGAVIYNAEDPDAVRAAQGAPGTKISFGMSAKAQVYPEDVSFEHGMGRFTLCREGRRLIGISLKVPGRHNIGNALAAAASALFLGMDPSVIKEGLEGFSGAGRRFEYKGEINGAAVFDDYAHHPTEIATTIASARAMDYRRVIVVFQPHTYSRTRALFKDFRNVLRQADLAVLADIYAARERDDGSVSSQELAEEIPGAVYRESFREIADYLRSIAQPGDIILTVGAGDVYHVGEMLLRQGK